ncbi:GntR family transcriptional regulator [Pseudomonas protegens]|uniref:GntR family transcriptional regulator n=1 Tax=Pseudomonas protegens TaxID=380021 RepID=UPI0023EC4A60|nr:GntR family transcriptional regulator [Pseudomonas protegens]MDF4210719.1 GntR family transcriptional regulator [Pseudomonas protegens]BFD44500.1 GntR family transcriptional regulator [Pseudomonas sp. FFPRI_1]
MVSYALKNNPFTRVASLPRRPCGEKKLLVDDVYPQIFDAILELRIAPGSRFTEDSLGQAFGVSRSIIRQVLARLSHQQVIILRPNHRPQVAAPDQEQTRQILHARRLTEITLVHLACQQPRQQLQPLRQLIAREREAIERDQRGPAIRLSGEFHLQLAQIAGNGPLAQFLGSLVPLTSLAIAQFGGLARHSCAWQEHSALVDALQAADASKAESLMNQHLDHLQLRLLGDL